MYLLGTKSKALNLHPFYCPVGGDSCGCGKTSDCVKVHVCLTRALTFANSLPMSLRPHALVLNSLKERDATFVNTQSPEGRRSVRAYSRPQSLPPHSLR